MHSAAGGAIRPSPTGDVYLTRDGHLTWVGGRKPTDEQDDTSTRILRAGGGGSGEW